MNSATDKWAFKYPVFVNGTFTLYFNSAASNGLAAAHDNMFQSEEHRFSRCIKKIVVTKFVPAPPKWSAEDYSAIRLELAVNESCLKGALCRMLALNITESFNSTLKKKFPLNYYMNDVWDGKNLLVEGIVADVQQIHTDGNWPKEGISAEEMVAMIRDLAPEYALAFNQHKYNKGRFLGNCRDFDVHHWILKVGDPSLDKDMALMNELRTAQGLAVSCMLMSNIPGQL